MAITDKVVVRELGLQPYEPTWHRMQAFTDQRSAETVDEIWLLEHEPVFTQGQAGKAEHVLNPGDIPVVQVDRGGQVTYHGPGQLLAYLMIDLRRRNIGVRDTVDLMEQAVVRALADFGVEAYPKPDAPGVYVDGAKISSLGLRVRRGATFHGLALNLDMEMEPFLRINPCGYAGLAMTQLRQLAPDADMSSVPERLLNYLIDQIGYTSVSRTTSWDE